MTHGPIGPDGKPIPEITDEKAAAAVRTVLATVDEAVKDLSAVNSALTGEMRRFASALRWRLREWEQR